MNFEKKYLKYKKKYLLLKNTRNQKAGSLKVLKNILDSNPSILLSAIQHVKNKQLVHTIFNDGNMDGMSNQCIYISILTYLHSNSYPSLTLEELRKMGGLDASTKDKMFDGDEPESINAINRICNNYNLEINILQVNPYGDVKVGYDSIFGKGKINKLSIANYGMAHFELVIDDATVLAEKEKIKVLLKSDINQLVEMYPKSAENVFDAIYIIDKLKSEIIDIEDILVNSFTLGGNNFSYLDYEIEKKRNEILNLESIRKFLDPGDPELENIDPSIDKVNKNINNLQNSLIIDF